MRAPKFVSAAAFAVAAATVGSTILAAPAWALTTDGAYTVTDPGTNGTLTTGIATKQYTITLPAHAKCSGDTATAGYHVYGYAVHVAGKVTKAALTTAVQGLDPVNGVPSQFLPLTDNGGNFYGPANTAIGTGQIVSIPLNLEWAPLNSILVNNGLAPIYGTKTLTYQVGIFCANPSNKVIDFWNMPLTFTKGTAAQGGFTWKVGKHI
jgi:hypothetical protein